MATFIKNGESSSYINTAIADVTVSSGGSALFYGSCAYTYSASGSSSKCTSGSVQNLVVDGGIAVVSCYTSVFAHASAYYRNSVYIYAKTIAEQSLTDVTVKNGGILTVQVDALCSALAEGYGYSSALAAGTATVNVNNLIISSGASAVFPQRTSSWQNQVNQEAFGHPLMWINGVHLSGGS